MDGRSRPGRPHCAERFPAFGQVQLGSFSFVADNSTKKRRRSDRRRFLLREWKGTQNSSQPSELWFGAADELPPVKAEASFWLSARAGEGAEEALPGSAMRGPALRFAGAALVAVEGAACGRGVAVGCAVLADGEADGGGVDLEALVAFA